MVNQRLLLPCCALRSLVFVLLLFSVPKAVLAQDSSNVASENLSDLISRIEDPAKRDQLIADLRMLQGLETSSPNEDVAKAVEQETAVDKLLKIDESASELKGQYDKFLEKYQLSAGFVSKTLGSAGIVLLALIVISLLRRFIRIGFGRLRSTLQRLNVEGSRLSFYASVIKTLVTLLIALGSAFALLTLWNISIDSWLSSQAQLRLMEMLLSSLVIILVAAIVMETVNVLIEYAFRQKLNTSQARIDTLLPIARNIAIISLTLMFTLTLLSEMGINVVPLLAGAGVAGIAIGFGAQALVKDIITGFILIVEDHFRVGDVARVGGKIGLVERITVRYVQLRDLAGIVYTVPFGEITTVENLTKEFSFYLMDVGVAYRENTDEVIEHLKSIDEEMREDEKYKENILAPLEVLGVDAFADSAVIIKARIKTKPIKQWEVGREFNRRMKLRFDEYNIEIPFPHQTIYFGEDKGGAAPAAKVEMLKTQASA